MKTLRKMAKHVFQFAGEDESHSAGIVFLVLGFTAILCLSARMAASHYYDYYLLYDSRGLYFALLSVAAMAGIALFFAFVRFSFGYAVGFNFYAIIAGYLWLNCFSKFQYDHLVAGLSAALSLVAFLLPATLITTPLARARDVREQTFWRLLIAILVICIAVVAAAATYNFRLASVDVGNIYQLRELIQIPPLLRYGVGIASSACLPFAFALFVTTKRYAGAVLVLLILISFYPVTLSKTAFFMPAWLVMLAAISRLVDARTTTILSLLLPVLAGIVLIGVFGEITRRYFDIVILRMTLSPSSALDVYNEYFARHPLTHFCQINMLKPFIACALDTPLAVEMQNNYGLGNLNASLFATEGIASVGPWLAPVSAFLCGLVFALGNRLSAGLPGRFVLLSSAAVVMALRDIPLSIVAVTHGMWALFLLWYVTPRAIFDRK